MNFHPPVAINQLCDQLVGELLSCTNVEIKQGGMVGGCVCCFSPYKFQLHGSTYTVAWMRGRSRIFLETYGRMEYIDLVDQLHQLDNLSQTWPGCETIQILYEYCPALMYNNCHNFCVPCV